MPKNALFRIAVLTCLLAGSSLVPAVPWTTEVSHAAETETVSLAVEGMTCASCTFAVKAALKKLDGVEGAKVSFREKSAVVTYDPQRVTPDDMVSAIDDTGFAASLPEAAQK